MSQPLARHRPAPPVRLVHLGLGNFFRAHAAWYTAHAPDAAEHGYAAFSGRSAALAQVLERQGGRYTLVTRGATDAFEVVDAVAEAYPGSDDAAWRRRWRDPALQAVTVTVTEAGHHLDPAGRLRQGDPDLDDDVAALRRSPEGPARTAPGRLLAGLAARAAAGAPPVALVACDNLPSNGAVLAGAVRQLAERVDARRAAALVALLVPVTTVVDRITPAATDADRRLVAAATGADDAAPVVTEPFAEWVLAGDFPAGRPSWEAAGARLVDDVRPYATRKLLLLNGGHSLLAYAGGLLGHRQIDEAVADERLQEWLEQWWDEAATVLAGGAGGPGGPGGPAGQGSAASAASAAGFDAGAGDPLGESDLAAYRATLLGRFANVRLADRLERIAADGTDKLRVRVVPVLAAARAGRRLPPGVVRLVAAWLCHLDGLGAPVRDARAGDLPVGAGHGPEAARRALAALDPSLADDTELAAAVAAEAAALAALAAASGTGR